MPNVRRADKEYGIVRKEDDNRRAWIVNIKRRSQLINRYFADDYYGGPEDCLKSARSYRNAVLEAFPPYTTLELAQGIRRDNLSGVAGVQHTPSRPSIGSGFG